MQFRKKVVSYYTGLYYGYILWISYKYRKQKYPTLLTEKYRTKVKINLEFIKSNFKYVKIFNSISSRIIFINTGPFLGLLALEQDEIYHPKQIKETERKI